MRKLQVGIIEEGNWGKVLLRSLSVHEKATVPVILTRRPQGDFRDDARWVASDILAYASVDDYQGLQSYRLDALIVAGWMRRIPTSILEAVDFPFVNIHPSLLPRYRGPEPLIQQLLHRESQGGVTIHEVVPAWDAGDILVQTTFSISIRDTATTLFLKAARVAEAAFGVFMEALAGERPLERTPQDEDKATYYCKVDPIDHVITSDMTIEEVQRRARAFRGTYPILAELGEDVYQLQRFECVEGTASAASSAMVRIRLRDGWLCIYEHTPWNIL